VAAPEPQLIQPKIYTKTFVIVSIAKVFSVLYEYNNMQYFHLNKFAQIENFLRQQGYSENLVSLVLSKPKNVHKAVGKIISDNPGLSEDELVQK
jgi:hypothetical protein